jgi:hypothetical protein
MRELLVTQTYNEYGQAMGHVRRAMRRGDLKLAKEWMDMAERCMRVQSRLHATITSETQRYTTRAEHPYRLKILEYRARYPRGI